MFLTQCVRRGGDFASNTGAQTTSHLYFFCSQDRRGKQDATTALAFSAASSFLDALHVFNQPLKDEASGLGLLRLRRGNNLPLLPFDALQWRTPLIATHDTTALWRRMSLFVSLF